MLSDEAQGNYDEALQREKDEATSQLQCNSINSAIKAHFRKRLRQQARLFSVELAADLSELFGRPVNPKEVYQELTFFNASRAFVNLSDESADEKEKDERR